MHLSATLNAILAKISNSICNCCYIKGNQETVVFFFYSNTILIHCLAVVLSFLKFALQNLRMISKKYSFLFAFLFILYFFFSQDKFTQRNNYRCKETKKTLIGVNVYIPETKSTALTNEDMVLFHYTSSLQEVSHHSGQSYIGFGPSSKQVALIEKTPKPTLTIRQQ
jgi:hypothetical protein